MWLEEAHFGDQCGPDCLHFSSSGELVGGVCGSRVTFWAGVQVACADLVHPALLWRLPGPVWSLLDRLLEPSGGSRRLM